VTSVPRSAAELLDLVRSEVAAVLGHDSPAAIGDDDRTLLEQGLGSVAAVQLQQQLAAATGVELPAVLLVDELTPAALARVLADATPAPGGTAAEPPAPPAARPATGAVGADSPAGPSADRAPAPLPDDPAGDAGVPVEDRTSAGPSAAVPGRPDSPAGPSADRAPAAGAPARPARPAGSITALVREAHRAGRLLEAVPLLRDAAALRASLRSGADPPAPAAERLVSDGDEEPQLVCIPSFLAGSGPHQFVRLAAALPRQHRVRALTLPGYGPGESAPAAWPAVVDALAEAARRGSERPFVLLGYSVGGALALAAADALAAAGARVAGVVLLDTFDPAGDQWPIFAWAMGQVLDRGPNSVTVDDEGLLAMGAYLRLLEGWTASRPAAPSLLVGADPAGPQPRWPLWPGAEAAVTVPGADHFSLIEEHAEQVARAVDSWLTSAPQVGAGVSEEGR
jgi:hypothetical protein